MYSSNISALTFKRDVALKRCELSLVRLNIKTADRLFAIGKVVTSRLHFIEILWLCIRFKSNEESSAKTALE